MVLKHHQIGLADAVIKAFLNIRQCGQAFLSGGVSGQLTLGNSDEVKASTSTER